MNRLEATRQLVTHLHDEPVIANLGPTSVELWHARDRDRNFYTNGGMGLCSSFALGIALSIPDKVIALEGDGSLLMNLGTIASIAREKPKNLVVVVWDNEEWGQTGHQRSHTATGTDLEKVARGCGIPRCTTVRTLEDLDQVFQRALSEDGPWFIVAKIQEGESVPGKVFEPVVILHRFRSSFRPPDRGGLPVVYLG